MRISEAQALPDYQLQLRYASGECGVVNLSTFVGRGVFKAWENEAVFNSVRVTDEGASNGRVRLIFVPMRSTCK